MALSQWKEFKKAPPILAICVACTCAAVPRASAASLYATNLSTSQLEVIDTATNSVTNVFADSAGPRGLVFTKSNNIVYTTFNPGQLKDYNLATHTSSVLATLPTPGGAYLALDPGGASVVFGSFSGIDRFNLNTHAVTNLSSFGDPRGLAYDSAGRLFAVLGPSELAQLNPVTGAIIASVALPSTGSAGSNGLAFDPVTGELFVTDDTNDAPARGLYEIPTDLSSATLVSGAFSIGIANGLTADGNGNLWIAASNNLDEFNTASHTLTTGASDPVLWDVAIAPAVVTSTTPEPASLLLFGTGLLAVGIARRKFHRRSKR